MECFLKGVFSKSHSRGDEDTLGETCTWQLSLKVEKPTFPREGNTILKVIISDLRSSPHQATLLAFWPFYVHEDRKPLLTETPQKTWMRRLVLMKKADYGLGSGSHGSFVLDFTWTRLSHTSYVKFGRDFWHDTDPGRRNLSAFLHKFPNVWCMKKNGSIIKKKKKPNLLDVQARHRGCSHWGCGASVLYQHEHFTSAVCQVSFTDISGQLFLHWKAPNERNWSAPGEI